MRRMNYEHALQLLRKGRFRELIQTASEEPSQSNVSVRVVVAYVLALTGETSNCASLIDIPEQQLAPGVRAQFQSALGIFRWRAGDFDEAWKHLNAAVQAAADSNDAERIAWANLHLLRFAVDTRPADALAIMLPRARRAVIRAGFASATAYLHTCVATMEGSRGHFDEAWRHCDIAESLLAIESNAWVLGASLLNRGCISTVRCEFSKAADYFRSAIALADVNGSLRARGGAEGNVGYLELITGQFAKAEATLLRRLSTARGEATIDASDFLARVYLATGNLHLCEQTLERLNLFGTSVQYSEYATRWTAITRAKLL